MKVLTFIAAALILSGCSSDDVEEAEETVGKQIADGYNDALNKASDVEDQVLEQKKKIDAALEEAENAAQDP